MVHSAVYGEFKKLFPNLISDETVYFQNGRNSIRLRNLVEFYKRDFIFTYSGPFDWKFETVDSFIKTM